jgi:hypothetical protein
MPGPINPLTQSAEPLHPSGRPLSEFERNLWRLKLVGHEAHLLLCSAIRTEERKKDQELLFTLGNYALLLVCKFLEIWDDFNHLGKDNRRVREVTRAVSPAVRRITKTWPNLRDYRNWTVAHPYRIREESEITPPWALLQAQVAPDQPSEALLLLDCVRMVIIGTLAHFGDLYRQLAPTFDAGRMVETPRGVVDGVGIERERRVLAAELDTRLADIGVDLKDSVFREFTCSPPEDATKP